MEVAVVDVHFIVRVIGGEQEIPRGIAGNGQAGVYRARGGYGNDGRVGIRLRRPSADGAVQGGEQEYGRPSLDLKFSVSRIVESDASGGAGAVACGGNQHVQGDLGATAGVQRRPA